MKPCPNCKKMQIQIDTLCEEVAKLKKNSSNSSKPPSSDIVKPKNKKDKRQKGRKRKIGGQKGHKKNESQLKPSDADNEVELHADKLTNNASLNLELATDIAPRHLYQYEFVEKPTELTVWTSSAYRDLNTGEIVYAPFPDKIVKAGILGSHLTTFAACIKGTCHASISGVKKTLDFLGVPIAKSTICKKLKNVSLALESPYNELLNLLPNQTQMNVDETGHKDSAFVDKDNREKYWNWVFATPQFTLFKLFPTRSSNVLFDVLGEDCETILGSDFFGAYKKYAKTTNVVAQFCWAHLIREIKFLSESPNEIISKYGLRLLKKTKKIFHLIHQREELGEPLFLKRIKKLKTSFLKIAKVKKEGSAVNMSKRMRQYGEEYFTFLKDPSIEPTNNLAEQQIRYCVIDRKVTQGTRGKNGREWSERIWTATATCERRGRKTFDYIFSAVDAYYNGLPIPSLIG